LETRDATKWGWHCERSRRARHQPPTDARPENSTRNRLRTRKGWFRARMMMPARCRSARCEPVTTPHKPCTRLLWRTHPRGGIGLDEPFRRDHHDGSDIPPSCSIAFRAGQNDAVSRCAFAPRAACRSTGTSRGRARRCATSCWKSRPIRTGGGAGSRRAARVEGGWWCYSRRIGRRAGRYQVLLGAAKWRCSRVQAGR